MPIYEYQCAACGMILEKWQRVSEDPIKVCPQCGGAMNKLVSCCSFQLKGSGWYQTDYCGKSQAPNMDGASKPPEGAAPASAADAGNGKDAGATPKTEGTGKTESSNGTKTETISPGKIK
ncbi:MAG: zinc ribbon domain-containing protein [Deltaproteobacteria bacterium]|nr:zinc ribbon domain-containing protein [Deltaproteobacteria bacterium]